MTITVKITQIFEVTSVFKADNCLHAFKLNSEWLAQEYGNLEQYKTNEQGFILEEVKA
jgi:hypothetical protein